MGVASMSDRVDLIQYSTDAVTHSGLHVPGTLAGKFGEDDENNTPTADLSHQGGLCMFGKVKKSVVNKNKSNDQGDGASLNNRGSGWGDW